MSKTEVIFFIDGVGYASRLMSDTPQIGDHVLIGEQVYRVLGRLWDTTHRNEEQPRLRCVLGPDDG